MRTAFIRLAAASLVAALTGPLSAIAADWVPKKPIDFVIMAGQGGGADKMARLMQSIIEKHQLSSQPFVPINKPGGSGAEALLHLKKQTGDDHTIMVTLNSFYTTPLRQPGLKIDVLEFTPIARMAEDTFVLWVNSATPIKTFDEFLAAAKSAGSDWVMAGTGKAQEDELLTQFLNASFDLDIKYIPFQGGGDVAKQLAGQHANSTVNNPSEILGFYQAGNVRPVVTFTPERLPQFPDAPSLKEATGSDFSYFMQRSVVGAPGMSAEATAFYQDLFNKVYATEEWQKYMQDYSLQGEFLTDQALKDYWVRELANHEKMLKQAGS